MTVKNPLNAQDFLSGTQNILENDEANGNLIFGLAKKLYKNKNHYGADDPFYSIAYNDKNSINLIGLMTPPRYLIIHEHNICNDNLLRVFVTNVLSKHPGLPGINGEKSIAGRFIEIWKKETNGNSVLDKNMRLYKLEKVIQTKYPKGFFRIAEMSDFETIYRFYKGFQIEIDEPEKDDEKTKETAKNLIINGEIYVWDNNGIVSMAGKQRPSNHGMAVGPVYTPEPYRKNGYATACVSELSKKILEEGKKYCVLYTDLSNSVSNSIYQKIGYKPITDYITYKIRANGV